MALSGRFVLSGAHRKESEARVLLGRVFSFAALPLISSISPFLLLPLIARKTDADGWTSLLGSQAIGTFAATIVMFGWSASGAARVARSHGWTERRQIYAASLLGRAVLAAIVFPVAGLAGAAISSPGSRLSGVLMAVAMSISGFSIAWFCIGVGNAKMIAMYDAGPRIGGTIVAALLLLIFDYVWIYPLVLIVSSSAGIAAFNLRVMGRLWPRNALEESVWKTSVGEWRVAAASIGGAAYASAPLPVAIHIVGQTSAAGLASVDKLYRYGLLALVALTGALHAWVLDPEGRNPRRRQAIAVLLHAVIGAGGAIGMGLFGARLTEFLFGGQVAAPEELCWIYGVTFLVVSLSTPLVRNLLIPFGGSGATMAATAVGIIVGLPALVLGGEQLGARGVALAFFGSEAMVLCLLALPALKVYRALKVR